MTAETEQVQHTPGPWGLFYIDNPEGYDMWDVGPFDNPSDPFSGQADTLFSGVAGGAEQEANARLIAAAPELLEALERIAWEGEYRPTDEELDGPDGGHFLQILGRWDAGERARAALRKARGNE